MYLLCSILRGRKRIIMGNHGKVLIKRKSNFGEKVAGSEYRLLNTVLMRMVSLFYRTPFKVDEKVSFRPKNES